MVTNNLIKNGNQLNINPDESVDNFSNAFDNVTQKAGEIANDASNKVGDAVDVNGIDAMKALLSAFNNLIPKVPVRDKSGIARPIIAATVLNSLSLLLLLSINDENKKFIYVLVFILLFVSFILNISSFFITFSIFSLLFNLIEKIPGIGDNSTGSAIYLSGLSSAFLFIALIVILRK